MSSSVFFQDLQTSQLMVTKQNWVNEITINAWLCFIGEVNEKAEWKKNQCMDSSLNEKLMWGLGSHNEEVTLLVWCSSVFPVVPSLSLLSSITPSHPDIIIHMSQLCWFLPHHWGHSTESRWKCPSDSEITVNWVTLSYFLEIVSHILMVCGLLFLENWLFMLKWKS